MGIVVKATVPKKDNAEVEVILESIGDDLDQAIELVGKEVVFTNYRKSAIITAQAAIRRFKEKGSTDEEIQSKMSAWKPGVALERVVDPMAVVMNKAAAMSAEELEAFITAIREKAGK